MSARAAGRLESLGFTKVYRYTAGKLDWQASGLPVEGEFTSTPHVGEVARSDIPVCQLTDRVGEIQQRVRAAGWDECVVVNQARVVLGLIRSQALVEDSNPQATAEAVMESAPRTYRPYTSLDKPIEYMNQHEVGSVLVTTSEGILLGAVQRKEAERAREAQTANQNAA